VTARPSQAVDEQLISTLAQEEKGEETDNWCFDVFWAAREAIEAADPWDNQAAFTVVIAGRTLELCVVIHTTHGRVLHILTAEEARR
jgi:hypothetical protein